MAQDITGTLSNMPALGAPQTPPPQLPRKRDMARRILAAVIVIIVLSALAKLCINAIAASNNTISPVAKHQIDSLNKVVLSQWATISAHEKKITDFQIQVDTLQSIKEANLEKINKLKNEYKIKASRVAAYDSDSLNSFFRDRYN